MRTGDRVIDAYTAKAVGVYLLLSQDKTWTDVEGNEILLDDMSVRYKRHLLSFLAKRATGLGNAYSWGSSMAPFGGGITPCAGPNGESECAAGRTGNEWEHGAFHGAIYPGSEIESMFAQEFEATLNAVRDAPIRWLHGTALGARLVADINNRVGGSVD